MNPIKFQITNESVTFIWKGSSVTVKEGSPNFKGLRSALLEKRWNDVEKHLTVGRSLESWAKGKFTVVGDVIKYDGKDLPSNLSARISAMARNGESPEPLFLFWGMLQNNPSYRSVHQLWEFLSHHNIPLSTDGHILAYKAVTHNYKDYHTETINNRPGVTNQMPRNEISDDPEQGCHVGFHVGAIGYATTFGSDNRRTIICKVNPADVVCVPYDSSYQKMRVCKYTVIGNYGSDLPDTVFTEDSYDNDLGKRDETDDASEEDAANAGSLTRMADAMGFKSEDEDGGVARAEKEEAGVEEKRKSKKGFAKFDKMDMGGLMQQSIEDLRKYATHGLEITGASKIPGGKTMLVMRILEVRR